MYRREGIIHLNVGFGSHKIGGYRLEMTRAVTWSNMKTEKTFLVILTSVKADFGVFGSCSILLVQIEHMLYYLIINSAHQISITTVTVKCMQRSGTEAIRIQLQPSKPKREITNITNIQNTKITYGQPSEQPFPRRMATQQPKPN